MPERAGACKMVTVERPLTNLVYGGTMTPSNHTLEAMTKARIEDRIAEAAQLHQARRAKLSRPRPAKITSAEAFGWLRQIATRLIGAGA